MSIEKSTQIVVNNDWDLAILDAKKRIKRMKASIKLWEEMRDKGEKWPGFEVSGQEKSDADTN